jgi:hypothetical protein
MIKIMLKKMIAVLGDLTALFGTIPMVRDTVSFRKITVRVYNSIVPITGKPLFKDANDIWVLGKNNLSCLGACRLLPTPASLLTAISDCSQKWKPSGFGAKRTRLLYSLDDRIQSRFFN